MRRRRRILGAIAIGLAAAVLLPPALLLIAPVRERVAREALERASDRGAGEFRIGQIDWESLGHLRLEGVAWIAEGDTLAAAESMVVQVEMRPLFTGEIVVDRIEAEGVRADVPAILAALPAAADADRSELEPGPATIPFPPDIDALVPALRLRTLRIDGGDLRVAAGQDIATFALEGAAEVSSDRRSWASLRLLHVTDAAGVWSLDSLAVEADLDSLAVEVMLRGGVDGAPLGASVRAQTREDGVSATGSFVLPGPRDLRRFLPAGFDPDVDDWGEVRGELTLDATELASAVALDLSATEWLDAFRVEAVVRGRTVQLDTLRVEMPGLGVTASGSADSTRVDARATLVVPDARLLHRLGPAVADLDFTTRAEIAASGPLRAPEILLEAAGRLTAPSADIPRYELRIDPAPSGRRVRLLAPDGATTGETTWQLLEIEAVLPADTLAAFPLRASVRAESEDIGATLTAALDRSDEDEGVITATLDDVALRLRTQRLRNVEPVVLRVDPSTGAGLVESLRLAGDLGTVWAEGTVGPDTLGIRSEVDLHLPSEALRALLPESIRPGDEESSLSVFAHVATTGTPRSPQGDLDVRVELTREDGEPPSGGAFAAEVRDDRVSASGTLLLPGPRHLQPFLPADLELDVDDWGAVRGDLDLEATGLLGVARGADLSALALDARIDLSATEWLDVFRVEGSARGRSVRIDTLHVELPGLQLMASGTADTSHVDARASLVVPDRELLRRLGPEIAAVDVTTTAEVAATGPLHDPAVRLEAAGRLAMPQLDLPRYEIRVDTTPAGRRILFLAPDGATTGTTAWDRLELDATLPADTLAAFPLRASARAESDEFGASVAGAIDRSASGAIDAAFDELALHVRGRDLANLEPVVLHVDPSSGSVIVESLRLVGDLGSVWAEGRVGADTLGVRSEIELVVPPEALRILLPEEFRPRNEDLGLTILANTATGGTPREPEGEFDVRVVLAAPGAPSELGVEIVGALEAEGARAEIAIDRGSTSLAVGRAELPGRVDPESRTWRADENRPVSIDLRAPGVDLSLLNPLLPEDLRLAGTLRADLAAEGPLEELALSGDLALESLEARIRKTSWLAAHCNARLEGTTRAPRVTGTLETTSGSIELPPAPPPLHPETGGALLWGMGPGDEGSNDANRGPNGTSGKTNGTGGPAPAPDEPVPAAAPPIDLDLRVLIPGDVRLRGPGLRMELAGDVRIHSLPGPEAAAAPDAVPSAPGPRPIAVSGTVEVREGTYRFLNREFALERGEATFYGEAEPNPELDIALRTNTEDAVVRILVTGTAREPRVTLASDPEMSEGEILTLLLTEGREDVDPAALLAGLGLARVTSRAAARTGLDSIEYRPATDEGASSSLVVGKYVSPRLVLKYEQSLDEASAFLAHLDYIISRHFKLKTSYAAGGASGVELFWTRTD